MESISGFATIEGTEEYKKRYTEIGSDNFYKYNNQNLSLSSIGVGTYKGDIGTDIDKKWYEALKFSLMNGINVIDTAIRYRRMKSERIIGKVVFQKNVFFEILLKNV